MDQIHRASGSPRAVILAKPQESSFLRIPGVVILAKPESPYLPLLSRCTFRRTDASRTKSIFYPQAPCNQSFGQPNPAQPIDSKKLTHKSFMMYVFPVTTT